MTDTVLAQLVALKAAPAPALKAKWRTLFDTEPPPYNRRFLESRLAYRIQELAYGGLKKETVERLRELGKQYDGKAGTRLKGRSAIERAIPIRTADARLHARYTSARPLIEMMKPWLEKELGRVPPAGPLAEAIRYALARWPALTRFLDDGRIELDNNPVERAIRPIALGRKNHLFAGSDGGGVRWATVCSLIATAKLNNVEPFAWLRDVLQRMTDGHPASRLDELLPWNWQPITAKA